MGNSAIIWCIIFLLSCNAQETVIENPMLFVIAGQSNAVGNGEAEKSPHSTLQCFEYNSIINSMVPLKDPVGQKHLDFHQANTGSLAPTFAYTYASLADREVCIVQCARGGSALNEKATSQYGGNWSSNGKLLKNSFKKIDDCILKIKPGPDNFRKLNGIIWCQGESDGDAIGKKIVTPEEYKISLKELIASFREKYGSDLPFIIVETGRNSSCKECDWGYGIVRKIQNEVAQEDKNTFIGYDETKYFIDKNWLKDSVHYTQEALNDIGEKLAYFLIAHDIN